MVALHKYRIIYGRITQISYYLWSHYTNIVIMYGLIAQLTQYFIDTNIYRSNYCEFVLNNCMYWLHFVQGRTIQYFN